MENYFFISFRNYYMQNADNVKTTLYDFFITTVISKLAARQVIRMDTKKNHTWSQVFWFLEHG